MPELKTTLYCPNCGTPVDKYTNPAPTADVIVEMEEKIVLIKRKFDPPGWAIPGGFINYGETVEEAAVREANEETSLDVTLIHLLGVYSDPLRDPRHHTITTVFVGRGKGVPEAADDAADIRLFSKEDLPEVLAFDHRKVLQDYFRWKNQS